MKSKQEIESLNSDHIAAMISNRDWQLFLKTLNDKQIDLGNYSYESKCCIDCSQRHNILHFALQHNAPFYIVRQIVKNNPEFVYESNCMGHFPFQTALTNGTTPYVAEHLIGAKKKIVSAIDRDGKTSLHLAFDAYDAVKEDISPTTVKVLESLPDVIHLVCSLNPSHILEEDNNGMNVLEYAIEKDADYSVLRKLQKISMSLRRGKQCPRTERNSSSGMKSNLAQKSKNNIFKKIASISSGSTRAKIIVGRSA